MHDSEQGSAKGTGAENSHACGMPEATTRTTLILEDVRPDTRNEILDILLKARVPTTIRID